MIVLVAGLPRTGSMWTYNVTRALLVSAGKTIRPYDDADLVGVITEAINGVGNMGPDEAYCIKAHMVISPNIPHTKIINNYRDVRDFMLSYMRFMKVSDFERGLEFAKNFMKDTDGYFQQDFRNLIRINYDRMVAEPFYTIADINGFLGLQVGKDEMEEIAERFSRRKVQELIKSMDQVSVNSDGEVEEGNRERFVAVRDANQDGSYRVCDKETNFQTNHITSKNKGEWREVFTPEQQERLLALTSDWLSNHGFEV